MSNEMQILIYFDMNRRLEYEAFQHAANQKLRDDEVYEESFELEEIKLEYSRNIVTNSRVTPSWREIVSLTFIEVRLNVNWISLWSMRGYAGVFYVN
ncbi:hypothetical protein Tco_0206452 [Tanacetum coccineum]